MYRKIILFVCHILLSEINGQNQSDYTPHYDNYVLNSRKPDYPLHPLLLSRISSRDMSGEPMSDAELFPLFEAARWSPSSYNLQPWNFVYAKRDTHYWQGFFDLLVAGNQAWCMNASVLVIVVSNIYEAHRGIKMPNSYHTWDTGSATMSLVFEAISRGYAVRELGAFNATAAGDLMNISGNINYSLDVMLAIGKRPPEANRKNETLTQRVPMHTFISEGVFIPREIGLS